MQMKNNKIIVLYTIFEFNFIFIFLGQFRQISFSIFKNFILKNKKQTNKFN